MLIFLYSLFNSFGHGYLTSTSSLFSFPSSCHSTAWALLHCYGICKNHIFCIHYPYKTSIFFFTGHWAEYFSKFMCKTSFLINSQKTSKFTLEGFFCCCLCLFLNQLLEAVLQNWSLTFLFFSLTLPSKKKNRRWKKCKKMNLLPQRPTYPQWDCRSNVTAVERSCPAL